MINFIPFGFRWSGGDALLNRRNFISSRFTELTYFNIYLLSTHSLIYSINQSLTHSHAYLLHFLIQLLAYYTHKVEQLCVLLHVKHVKVRVFCRYEYFKTNHK